MPLRSVDKAEGLMQKVKAMGYVTMPVWYNNMMNLYYNLGNLEKLDFLMDEMEEGGIHPDKFTHIVRLRAYSNVSDSVGIDKVVRALHSDPQIIWDWSLYGVIAAAYLKVGSTDKALPMLQNMELLMEKGKKKDSGIRILFHLYTEAGKKDELYRIWKKYKKVKVYNNVYKSMISSLMKLEDIDGAESIFSEWESSALSYDFQIVNYLIDAYCRNGSLKKAEDLLNRGISRGGRPNAETWCNFAGGYIMENKLAEAINSLKKAVSLCPPNVKHINLETLNACLEYLEEGYNVDEFIRSSSPKYVPSMSVLDKLFCSIKTGQLPSDSRAPSGEDVTTNDQMMN